MEPTQERLNTIFDLLEDTVRYLHSWLCTKDGDYKPYSIYGIKNTLYLLLANPDTRNNVIDAFKEGVENGSISVSIHAVCLAENYKKELREQHLKNIHDLEIKYNIGNEESKKRGRVKGDS